MVSRQFHDHKPVFQHNSPLLTARTPREHMLKSTLDEMTRSESLWDIKLMKQKTKIKMLTERLSSRANIEESNISKLKDSVYTDLKSVNSQMVNYKAINMSLQNENDRLKELIAKKDKIISQFEEVAKETAKKFKEMEAIQSQQKQVENKQSNSNREALIKELNDLKILNQISFHQINHLNETIHALSKEKDYVIKKMNEQQLASIKNKEADRNKLMLLESDNISLKKRNDHLSKELNDTKRYIDTTNKEKGNEENKENEVHYIHHKHTEKENELMQTITNLIHMLEQANQEKLMLKNKLNSLNKQSHYSSDCNKMTYMMKNGYNMN